MKKIIILLLATFCVAASLKAQSPLTTSYCNIVITGDFDSQCIYDFKDQITDEYPDLMVACKNSTVTYTAHDDLGASTAVSYIWEIYGDVSHAASGNHVTVTWSNDDWGMVVVNIIRSDGDTCTGYSRVKLVDKPTVGAATIPAYTLTPSDDKEIRVCKGASIQFIDQSTGGESDIAGHLWTSTLGAPSSNPDYALNDVNSNGTVTHRVYNNCGCYNEEVYYVKMLDGDTLQLSCYGTVCEGAVVEYTALNPSPCLDYSWYVDGGTVLTGQGTATVTVQWDRPQNGYGILALDGTLCGQSVCPTLMSKRIPVIQDHLTIEGDNDVCLGESVVYSLPLLGSTMYTWYISPSTGVNTTMVNNTHEVRLTFNQPGTYHLHCSYGCDFLGCGPYSAEPLTITVKPNLEITGNDQICVANACLLQTSPSVNASWTAYNLAAGNAVAATGSGTSFSHTFTSPGNYLVTASHPNHCSPASFVLTVRDVPPAPSLSDLDDDNPHHACPLAGITLVGSPSNPDHSLVWAPACSTAIPQLYGGDSANIMYQGEVCDVWVYNYDRRLQCQSTDHLVWPVSELTPATISIPDIVTVCPGSLIVWGNDVVPDQSADGMLYEWTIQPDKQYCASVQGSHLSNSIVLAVNNIPRNDTFYVQLERRFCGVSVFKQIVILVKTSIPHNLAITGPDEVCVHSQASFTGSGGTSSSTYRWKMDGTTYSNNPVTHTFDNVGSTLITLAENPYSYCSVDSYWNHTTKNVLVHPLPMVQKAEYDTVTRTVYVVPSLGTGYSYDWDFFNEITLTYNTNYPDLRSIPLGSAMGTYYCTVTNLSTGCSKQVSVYYPGDMLPVNPCTPMTLSGSYDICTTTLSLSAQYFNDIVIWTVSGGAYSINTHGYHNRYADITFENTGTYTVTAKNLMPNCRIGEYTQVVDFIPDFQLKAACDHVEIVNNSTYSQSGQTVYFSVSNSINGPMENISMPVNQTLRNYVPSTPPPATYTFYLTGYGNSSIQSCPIGQVTLNNTTNPMNDATITSENPYFITRTCDNTPIKLTASIPAPNQIASTTWTFSDNSSYTTDNNYIYHTFKNDVTYNVTVSVIDDNGCTHTLNPNNSPFQITSASNPLTSSHLYLPGMPVCPFVNTSNLTFSNNSPGNHYTWSTAPIHGGNPHAVDRPKWYYTYVINDDYCQREDNLYVPFLNVPFARIHADNFSCCAGESISLSGDNGPGNVTLTYAWTVENSAGTVIHTFDTPAIAFTPPSPGTYTVSLTVSNGTCSATATETVTANPRPAAPSLAFSGSPCLDNAPVDIVATGYSGEIHWSNGETTPTAHYYTHGMASAYAFNPSVGCPSETATIRIDRQPDFNALLTGCYAKCKDFFNNTLPVYGLTDSYQTIGWNWKLNGSTIASGSGSFFDNPLLLPLLGQGGYSLSVGYAGSTCTAVSPQLNIDYKSLCDCDSLSVDIDKHVRWEDCQLVYDLDITLNNRYSDSTLCLSSPYFQIVSGSNVSINYTTTGTVSVAPGSSATISAQLTVLSLVPSSVTLRLVSGSEDCLSCDKVFSIDLMPDVDCEDKWIVNITPIHMTDDGAVYFSFNALLGSNDNLLGIWTVPPMVVDFIYNPVSGFLSGLCMIDASLLTQLTTPSGTICFRALVCRNEKPCWLNYCILVKDLLYLFHNSKGPKASQGDNDAPGNHSSPRLSPNPSSGKVTVEGILGEVVEVKVLDMHGRPVASFENSPVFDISALPSGTYIVRLRSRNADNAEHTDYLKLVKNGSSR